MHKVDQFITVKTNLSRSVNLVRDQSATEVLEPYILTSCALRGIDNVVQVCRDRQNSNKAWALIGVYGSGKSSFALYLSHLLSNPKHSNTQKALKKLDQAKPELATTIKQHLRGSAGYCKVLITGYPESLAKAFLHTLQDSIGPYYAELGLDATEENKRIKKLLKQKNTNLSEISNLIEAIREKIKKAKGKGLLIVIDELGKFLEYAARHGSDDIFLLQILAEQAYKTDKSRLLLFVLLHQSFDQYGKNLSTKLKNEWTKIQGRYETFPFIETTEQSLRVMAKVFDHTLPKAAQTKIGKDIQVITADLKQAQILPKALNQKTAVNLFKQCYPLHPVSVLLLPVLCQKIAQNERTLFNYLGGLEPFGLAEQMKQVKVGDFVYPAAVYDYFINGQPLTNDFQTQRTWVEVITAIDRLTDANAAEIDLLKTIGLFNIAGSTGGIKASDTVLKLCSKDPKSYPRIIKTLQKRSVITYRKFNHEYRVWQGSDFNLEQAISEQQAHVQTIDIARELNAAEVFLPFVAKRYSIGKHSLFYFQPQFINVSEYEKEPQSADYPRIIFCLSNAANGKDKKIFRQALVKYFSERDICVFCENSEEIKQTSRHRIALQKVGQVSTVQQDPVIQREFKIHFIEAQQQEKKQIRLLIEEPQRYLWYHAGEKQKLKRKRDIQVLLSKTLETVYPHTPIIKNELVNKDYPSAQANLGRKNLLLALLHNQDQENLGIEGYPPEKSMYLAILKDSGIHRLVKGKWQLGKPKTSRKQAHHFLKVWSVIDKFLTSTQQSAKPFSQLDAVLTQPPYGVKKAMLPVFYMMVYVCYQDEMAVYEDRNYIPYFTTEHLERFLKRPEHFSFQQFKIEGLTQSLIREYEQGIFEGKKGKNILSLFKPMAGIIQNIPEYTKQTSNISKTAQKVRDAFKYPKSPQELLFEKLPKACGHNRKRIKGFGETLKAALREIKNAYPDMLDRQATSLKKIFNLEQDDSLEKLRKRAVETCEQLKEYTLERNLRTFIDSVTVGIGDDQNWLERVVSMIANKPPKSWNDDDALYAQHKIMEYGRKLIELDKLKVYSREHKLNKEQGSAVLFSFKDSRGRSFDEIIYLDDKQSSDDKKKTIEKAVVSLVTHYIMDDRPKSTVDKKDIKTTK